MFKKDIGNRIKKVSNMAFYVAFIFCTLLGMYYMIIGVATDSPTLVIFGLSAIMIGAFLSFIISILLAGFGDMVESLHRIADNTEKCQNDKQCESDSQE